MRLLFALLFLGSLFADEIKYCQIVDEQIHATNREIVNNVLAEELASLQGTPCEQARALNSRIKHIAQAILKNGFSTRAYGLPEFEPDSALSYTRFALWEGEASNGIPITFFAYLWPSEEQALAYNADPLDRHFETCIHSHPIPCAFTVLQGSLVQQTFDRVTQRTVRPIQTDLFLEGEGEVDDLETLFIHQVYGKSPDGRVCISLNAYGLSSAEKVVRCFQEAYSDHSYSLR